MDYVKPSSHCYGFESAGTGGRNGIRSGPGALDPLDGESPMLHSLGYDWCIAFHPLLGQLGLSRLASIGHWNEWFSFPYERNGDEPGKGLYKVS